MVSYTLSVMFGLVFVFGIIQIYRVFFSEESRLIGRAEEELKLKRQEKLTLEQRRKREDKWLHY